MGASRGLLLLGFVTGIAAAEPAAVRIDVLRDVVDPESAETIAVAILATPAFDPGDVEPESLRLAAAAIVKRGDGATHTFEDVDGDGRLDLIVWFRSDQLRIDDETRAALLSGRTKGGVTLEGRDAIRTVRAVAQDNVDTKGTTAFTSVSPPPRPIELDPIEERGPDSIRKRYPGAITINDLAPATPYPATINVSGVAGVVSKLRVSIHGLSHSCYNDIDVLLVGPTGQSLILMSDVGSCGNAPWATEMTFDDAAPGFLSGAVFPPTEGSYRPSNTFGGDTFAAPAPVPSGATRLNAFHGTNPNGDWKLYVVDDLPGDTGTIAGGWTLDIVTMKTFCDTRSASIPAGAPGETAGHASLFPYEIDVSQMAPLLSKISVTLKGLSHEKPEDLQVRLESPQGGQVLLMRDSGGSFSISNLSLTFDDEAYPFVPDAGPIAWSGTYRPEAARSGGASLESFRGSNTNGVWKVWVDDVAFGGTGALTGGVCINVSTIVSADGCQMFPITVPATAPSSTSGPAFPYPSEINVAGTTGLVRGIQVKLLGLTHTYPDDLDILLQAPSGSAVPLMSDAGGAWGVTARDVAFDLSSPIAAPDEGAVGAGPYASTDYEPNESLPPLAPQPPHAGSLYGTPPNGDWRLWVHDDAGGDWGTIAGWCLNLDLAEPYLWACADGANPLQIPASGTSGPAGPYPSTAGAWQQGTVVGKVTVYFNNLTHSYPDDMDILLVGPRGQKVMLMSDAGGAEDIALSSVVFDDLAPEFLPNETQMTNGVYRPSNFVGEDTDTFPLPAPPGPYSSNLGDFNGTDPHGYWNLYVRDDTEADTGSATHWCVKIDPLYPAGDAANLRWLSKTSLAWDGAPNATYTAILRGTQAAIGGLVDGTVDSCQATVVIQQTATGIDTIPPPGSFFWYLATGVNGAVLGPTGIMRIGGAPTARNADFTANCPAP